MFHYSWTAAVTPSIADRIANQYSVTVDDSDEKSEGRGNLMMVVRMSLNPILKKKMSLWKKYIDALRDGDLTLVAAYYLSICNFATL